MPNVPRSRLALVVVNWEPMLHVVTGNGHLHYQNVATVWTECQLKVTGYVDDADKHMVTCLTCLYELWSRA